MVSASVHVLPGGLSGELPERLCLSNAQAPDASRSTAEPVESWFVLSALSDSNQVV